MNELLIVDKYKFLKDEQFLSSLFNEILMGLNLGYKCNCSLIILNNKEIRELNNKYRNIDKPTDVLSFGFDDIPNENHLQGTLGDIYISFEKVKEQSERYNHSINRELSYLFLHGILHLLGYDHQSKDEEKKMHEIIENTLKTFKIIREESE